MSDDNHSREHKSHHSVPDDEDDDPDDNHSRPGSPPFFDPYEPEPADEENMPYEHFRMRHPAYRGPSSVYDMVENNFRSDIQPPLRMSEDQYPFIESAFPYGGDKLKEIEQFFGYYEFDVAPKGPVAIEQYIFNVLGFSYWREYNYIKDLNVVERQIFHDAFKMSDEQIAKRLEYYQQLVKTRKGRLQIYYEGKAMMTRAKTRIARMRMIEESIVRGICMDSALAPAADSLDSEVKTEHVQRRRTHSAMTEEKENPNPGKRPKKNPQGRDQPGEDDTPDTWKPPPRRRDDEDYGGGGRTYPAPKSSSSTAM